MPQQKNRPLGVTILAILEVLVGILMLFLSFGMFLVSAIINDETFLTQIDVEVSQMLLDLGPMVLAIIGVVFLILAILTFVLAWGFLKGKKWAWWLGIILAVLQIISGVVSIFTSGFSGIISTLIPVLILIYLIQPSVKNWFGV